VEGTVPSDPTDVGVNNGTTDVVDATSDDDAGQEADVSESDTVDSNDGSDGDTEIDTGPTCTDEPCAQGDSQCTADGRVQSCVPGDDGCLEWSDPSPCTDGECENGRCVGCIDDDNDGYGENCGTGSDCDDSNPDIYEFAPELCDGIDNNCDGNADEAYSQLGQNCTVTQNGCTGTGTWVCNASEDGVRCEGSVSTSTEVCDGQDNDCDGTVDEGYPQLGQSCSVTQNGCTASGSYVCASSQDRVECDAMVSTSGEVCDGQDNDCDGDVDEDFAQLGQSCTVNQNGCTGSGTYVCNGTGSGVECDATINTSPETCDGVDNDCDGQIDEDYGNLGSSCQNGNGVCAVSGQIVCDPSNQWSTTCDAGSPNTQDAVRETCDGFDNDCDGQVDESACSACVEDSYEQNDSSLAGTDLTSAKTVSALTVCGNVGSSLDRDWFRMGTSAAGATVDITYPVGTNAAGDSYPDLRIDIFCDSSYCGNISGSGGWLSGTIPNCGTCNYAFYVYNSGTNPPSGTPYDVTRR
jgi:hypothetical protein